MTKPFTAMKQANMLSNKTLSIVPHNDSVTTRKWSAGSSQSSGGATSVPECVVHRDKAAVAVPVSDENPTISADLASAVAKKAFSLTIPVVDQSGSPAERLGQGGLIQCPSLPTANGTTSPSTDRVSALPVTALHNVLKDYFERAHYSLYGTPVMASPPTGGDEGITRVQMFDRHNQAYSSADAIQINFSTSAGTTEVDGLTWKYGHDVTSGEVIRKKFLPQTDVNMSFESVSSKFEYKIGQKIGMAVYRNYKFDFSNDCIYTNNGWDKNQLSQDDILRLFGNDHSVSIYTGEITAVSTDRKAFCHDINAFKGCSGSIVFLLDKNQNGLVAEQYYGKAIGVHAGAFDEIATVTTDKSQQSRVAKFNIAFAIAGFVEQDEYKASFPSPKEGDK